MWIIENNTRYIPELSRLATTKMAKLAERGTWRFGLHSSAKYIILIFNPSLVTF